MTVGELIEKLKAVDSRKTVEVECGHCNELTALDDVEPKGRRYPSTVIIK